MATAAGWRGFPVRFPGSADRAWRVEREGHQTARSLEVETARLRAGGISQFLATPELALRVI